ncbi:MAG: ABC transporter permease [Gaiellaceae bacterium]
MRALRTLTAPLVVAARRLRSDPLFAGALFAAVAATAFLFALVPQEFGRVAAESLEQTVAQANPLERDVTITAAGRIPAGLEDDPFQRVAARGEEYEQRLPDSLRAVVGGPRAVAETVRHTIVVPPRESGPPGTTRFLTLRHLDDAAGHLRAAEGRLPAGAQEAGLPFQEQAEGTSIEIALSAMTAEQLSLALGDRIYLAPAGDDLLARDVAVSERRYLAAEVVGILAAGPGEAAWLRESRLARAEIRDTETERLVYAYGLFPREAYGELLAGVGPVPLRYEWRYLVDAAAVSESDTDELAAGVRQLESAFGQTTFGQRLGLGARTGLGRILERHETDREAAAAVLAVGALALLAVALTVFGVLASLAAERRSESIALLRSRGGSVAQTLVAQAFEGLLVAVPAGALGYVAATLVTGRPTGLLPGLLVLAIVLAAGALLAAVAVGPARRALATQGRADVLVPRLSPLRLAIEALVVIAALAGAYLLRRRGLSPEGGFDPYLAAVPVLVGLATGLLALRLYPLPLHALSWAAAPRRDLVPVLGLNRLARQPSLAAAPLLVVLLATAVGVFAATMATSIAGAQEGVSAARLTPLDTSTLDVFRVGIAVAGGYAALALLLAPVLTARPRLRDFAYLRALGLSSRDVLRLAAVELGPPVAVALAIGILLGVGLAYLVEPGLDLSALAAGREAALGAPFLGPLLLVAAILLATAVATLLTAAAARRISLSRVLRMGER